MLGLDISYEDFVTAYLQASMGGDPVFAILPNEAVPADVRERFRRPVRQVLRAAYGQKRAGHDYEGYADETFAGWGWKSMRDHGSNESSIYARLGPDKRTELFCRQVDDGALAAPGSKRTDEIWQEIYTVFKGKGYKTDPQKYVGIVTTVTDGKDGVKIITHDQHEYGKAITDEWYTKTGLKPKPRHRPASAEHDERRVRDEATAAGAGTTPKPGKHANTCKHYVMSIMYLQRGTRPDISFAVGYLARHTDAWRESDDAALEYLMDFLFTHGDYVLVGYVHPDDLDNGSLCVRSLSDASFGDDRSTRRSTVGWIIFLKGKRTMLPLNWASTLFGPQTLSTAETEACGIQKATRAGIRATLLIEPMITFDGTQRALMHTGVTDSAAALAAVKNGGNGTALAHMPKTAGISIAWLSDYYFGGDDRELVWQTGKDFTPDAMTKILPQEPTDRYREDMGVVPAPSL